MALIKSILNTNLLTGLTWSMTGDKKYVDIPAGSDFTFNINNLPDFSDVYSNPEEFSITYLNSNGNYTSVNCNYVMDGSTKYTFSYKKSNDVINLSVYKSDGHLEINVRNGKLEEPMDLNQVEFELTYTPPEYPITISSTTNCTASVSPNTYVKDETTFTITVNPDAGYELDYILIQNLDGTSDYYQGTELTHLAEWDGAPDPLMPENPWGYRISAVCTEIPVVEYSIIISETEHGTVVADKETAIAGETVTLTITPEEGYELSTLTVVDGSGNTITVENNQFTMPEDNVNVSAVFTRIITIYTVTINETEHGNVEANPEEGEAGTVITLTITPDEGYELDTLTVESGGTAVAVENNQFVMPAGDVSVSATFKEIIPPTPVEGLRFTTTFNRYAIVDVTVKDDGSEADVDVRPLVYDTDVDLDETYETVLRSSCIFRQDLRVTVEVEMNKPDNKAENYTVKSTKVFINGEEI